MASGNEAQFAYPAVRRDETVVDDLHGVAVADPYRWLEDPDSEETAAFVAAQNEVTQAYITSNEKRDAIRDHIAKSYDYPKFGTPFRKGDRWYMYKNSGLQNQSVLYTMDELDGEQRVFLDPNLLADDGTASLRSTKFTEDGALFAYGVSLSGSDWQTIYVRDVASGEDLDDKIEWSKFSSIAWIGSEAFFYSRYDEPASLAAAAEAGDDDVEAKRGTETESLTNQKLFLHRIGTPQAEDVLVYAMPDHPEWMVGANVTDDGAYVLIHVSRDCDPVERLFYAAITEEAKETAVFDIVKAIDNFDGDYTYLANDGPVFWFRTNLDAPRYKVVRFNIETQAGDPSTWDEIIPQKEDTLQWASCHAETRLVASYMHDVQEVLAIHDLDGVFVRNLPLPTVGTVSSLSGRRKYSACFYKFVSFTYPGSIFRYDFETDEMSEFASVEIPGFDPSAFEVEQVFVTSKDGTRVPMFVVKRTDFVADGTTPTLLYGYGGFNISITPSFSIFRTLWVSNFNAVLAVANIRGGGEYGEEWHQAGCKGNKQNVFDDFVAAAEYLIEEKITSPAKLAIQGGSNGGLLVAACANQRPELFGAVACHVGVLDMLRFHLKGIGAAWTSDYGCADNKDEFEFQYAYSPLHNVPDAGYFPAMLVLTGSHDDRVSPLHSFKHAATLQHKLGATSGQERPIMIRIEAKAGHGAGKSTTMVIEEYADLMAFLSNALGAEWVDTE